MEILIVKGAGEGITLLSAFDNALTNAGVSNYNLICLSSVIPPNSSIKKIKKYKTPKEHWGHKLYVVKAEQRSDRLGRAIASGIGWYMLDDQKGLFVEHETEGAEGEDEEQVKQHIETSIKNSLSDLCKNRDLLYDESKVELLVSSTVVGNHPACVLTLAVYKAENWQ